MENAELATNETDDPALQPWSSAMAFFLPNAITASALCAGLVSVHLSIGGRYDLAFAAIVVSAILDALDGRVARKLGSSSRFGAEFDSLADFLSFGVAPIVLLYFWSGGRMSVPANLCLMAFALASALRLARFNSRLDEPKAEWRRAYFTGMPAPSAALAVMLPTLVSDPATANMNAVGFYACIIAFLMVSIVPTFSGKKLGFGVTGIKRLLIMGAAIILLGLFVTFPRQSMVVATLGYLASIPFSWYRFRVTLKSEGG